MRRVLSTIACTLLLSGSVLAAESGGHGEGRGTYPYGPAEQIDPRGFFTGKTVSAVAFLPTIGPSSVRRVMFQAFLDANGMARVHWWDERANRYSPVEQQRWSIDGSTFCIRLSAVASDPLCFSVHMWGPNFQGYNSAVGGMIKGDVRPERVAPL
jgi:hypothetical protein